MNDTLKSISNRYSCRQYTDKPLSKEELDAICAAATASPSAVNFQPWRIIAITDPDLLNEMEAEALINLGKMEDKTMFNNIQKRGGKVFYGAPCMIMIPTNTTESHYAYLDCGIMAENIALAAESLDLGNVICGMARLIFAGDKGNYFMEKLGIPDGFEFAIAVLIGHSANRVAPHEPATAKLTII